MSMKERKIVEISRVSRTYGVPLSSLKSESESEVAQLGPTLCDPMSMGFSRQEYWSGLPFPSPEDLPKPGTEFTSPALAGRFFTTEPPGKSHIHT